MKNRSFFVAGALLLASLFTTSCKEIMSNLDQPVSSYVKIDQTALVLNPGEHQTRVGETINTDGLEYTSSDPKVATVDSKTGEVTAVAPGVTVITASATANDYYLAGSSSYEVKVIEFSAQADALIGVGDYETLDFSILPADCAGLDVVWTTSDKNIATVDENGKVTAVADGTATITVNVGGKTAQCEVKAATKKHVNSLTDNTAQDGDVLYGNSTNPVYIADGATVALSNVYLYSNTQHASIKCLGNATIILAEDRYSEIQPQKSETAGIQIGGAGKTSVIKGKGQLYVRGGSWAAGIGNGAGEKSGSIEIQGGIINASGSSAAGIGPDDDGNSSVENITISGGIVYVRTSGNGAGIGSYYNKSCGNITISGGEVEASGGTGSAGIGSGLGGWSKDTSCGDITITGGKVKAYGGTYGAGIGTGCKYFWPSGSDDDNNPIYSMYDYTSICGKITISGGEIVATKGSKAKYDVGPGCWNEGPIDVTGTVGDVNVSVAVKDAAGDAATIWSGAAAAAPRRASCKVVKVTLTEDPLRKK